MSVGLSCARLVSLRTRLNASIVLMLDFKMRSVISDSMSPARRSAFTYSPKTLCNGLSLSMVTPRFSAKVRISFVTKVSNRSRPASGSFFSMEPRIVSCQNFEATLAYFRHDGLSASTGALCRRRAAIR